MVKLEWCDVPKFLSKKCTKTQEDPRSQVSAQALLLSPLSLALLSLPLSLPLLKIDQTQNTFQTSFTSFQISSQLADQQQIRSFQAAVYLLMHHRFTSTGPVADSLNHFEPFPDTKQNTILILCLVTQLLGPHKNTSQKGCKQMLMS